MKENIKRTLHQLISGNYPEKLLEMQSRREYTAFLDDMSTNIYNSYLEHDYETGIDLCMEITRTVIRDQFGPSRFDYIETLISNRFPKWYSSMLAIGIVTFEIINILTLAEPLFEQFPLQENDLPKPQLEQMITAIINDYRKQTVEYLLH